MSSLTPKLEESIGRIKDQLEGVARGEQGQYAPTANSIYLDVVALQVEIEEALNTATHCHQCEEDLPMLCADCQWERQAELDHADEVGYAHLVSTGRG